MTKIEEIARAILKRRYYDCEPDMYDHSLEGFFATLDPGHMEDALGEALAALKAIREPTQEMCEVGGEIVVAEDMQNGDFSMDIEARPDGARKIFTAMIDHLIQEGRK